MPRPTRRSTRSRRRSRTSRPRSSLGRSRCRRRRSERTRPRSLAGQTRCPGSAVYRAPRAHSSGAVVRPPPDPGACVIAAADQPVVAGPAEAATAVELHDITKRFPGVVANHDIDIVVERGHVHAIVGENGAGKSTLMNTLYGMHKPDEGTIIVNGKQVVFSSPSDAIAAGIGMVHQHFMLADNFTVLENIVLGSEPTHAGVAGLSRRPREDQPDLRVLRPGPRSGRAGREPRCRCNGNASRSARSSTAGASILILDEPTAVLVPQEVDELFANLRELKAEGLTVLFISHKLDEVLSVADEITVIRRGTTVRTVKPKRGHRAPTRRADGRQRVARSGAARIHRHRHRRAQRSST